MDDAIRNMLLSINKEFYQSYATSFAATRRRVQPGIRRVVEALPPAGDYLDLGCGSGALAELWLQSGRVGSYTGLDFSAGLLAEAEHTLQSQPSKPDLTIRFLQGDLTEPGWETGFAYAYFSGVLAFAVLHHIPSAALRVEVLRAVHRLLKPMGYFFHSEWQFQNSPRIMERVVQWEMVGIDSSQVEPGDTLLDWRHPQPGKHAPGLRYVHLFDRAELAALAAETGFLLREEFESDGEGGQLGLYQTWQWK